MTIDDIRKMHYTQKGIEEGIKEGREEGKVEERLEIARNMLTEGLSIEMIIKFTGLNREEIEKLMN